MWNRFRRLYADARNGVNNNRGGIRGCGECLMLTRWVRAATFTTALR
jgi:hypothetical protein